MAPELCRRLEALDQMAVGQEYPWVSFLPEGEQRRFGTELLRTLRACASIGRVTAFENLIASWSATAEVWSDPVLARELMRPVEEPEGSDVTEPTGL